MLYFATREVGDPLGSAHQSQAPYRAFRRSEGYVTLGAVTPKTWVGLCRALGLESLLDERYVDSSSRHAHRDTLIPAIEACTTTLWTAQLLDGLDAAGVPVRAYSAEDWPDYEEGDVDTSNDDP